MDIVEEAGDKHLLTSASVAMSLGADHGVRYEELCSCKHIRMTL